MGLVEGLLGVRWFLGGNLTFPAGQAVLGKVDGLNTQLFDDFTLRMLQVINPIEVIIRRRQVACLNHPSIRKMCRFYSLPALLPVNSSALRARRLISPAYTRLCSGERR